MACSRQQNIATVSSLMASPHALHPFPDPRFAATCLPEERWFRSVIRTEYAAAMSVCTQDGGVRDELNPTYFRERFALGGASRFGGFLSLIALATPCSINTSPLQE